MLQFSGPKKVKSVEKGMLSDADEVCRMDRVPSDRLLHKNSVANSNRERK